LSDPTFGAPGELGRLFRAAEADLPSQAQLSNVAERLGPLLAPPGATPASSAAGMPRALKLGLLAGALLGAVAIAVGVSTQRAPSVEKSAPSAVAPPANQVLTPALSAAAPAIAPSPSAEAPPAASATSPASNPAPRSSRAPANEALLLERARRALASDPARALALTKQHQQSFPNGLLKQEREVIAIEALRRLGKAEQAGERAGRFEKQYPDSAHRRAVETGLNQ
jgi:hypothetical protein